MSCEGSVCELPVASGQLPVKSGFGCPMALRGLLLAEQTMGSFGSCRSSSQPIADSLDFGCDCDPLLRRNEFEYLFSAFRRRMPGCETTNIASGASCGGTLSRVTLGRCITPRSQNRASWGPRCTAGQHQSQRLHRLRTPRLSRGARKAGRIAGAIPRPHHKNF